MQPPAIRVRMNRAYMDSGNAIEHITIHWWHPSALTPAEHNARAMLMGRYYNPVMHDYRVNFHEHNEVRPDPLDAETLTPPPYPFTRRDKFVKSNGLENWQVTELVKAAYHHRIDYRQGNNGG